jgi:3-hydroxyisobutyrate dehydrogenase-like beta-hydroxyacid dehydrogenase
MGEILDYFGRAGSGQRVKMSNQILDCIDDDWNCGSMLYAEKANLDLEKSFN